VDLPDADLPLSCRPNRGLKISSVAGWRMDAPCRLVRTYVGNDHKDAHTHTRMHTRTSSLIEVRNVSRHAQQQCDASNDNSRRREDCAWVCSKHSGWVCAHSASTHLLDRPHRRLYRGGARLLRVLLVRHVPSRVLPKYVNADPLPPVPRRQHNAMQCE
jgi:hypothetical protein